MEACCKPAQHHSQRRLWDGDVEGPKVGRLAKSVSQTPSERPTASKNLSERLEKSYSLPSIMTSDSSLPWLLPLITMLIVFAIIPFFYNIYLSFHEFVPLKRALIFVGWENWIKLFTDGVFWGS